jgi:4-diphosphocytidyl-2-C-methyl-D-erythritol kinase
MTPPAPVALAAPAKLNLGLAVLGRRADGFHELATILQAVGRYDDLTVALDPGSDAISLMATTRPSPGSRIIAVVAAARVRAWAGSPGGLRLTLAKTIPVAAGMGGASADAAAALLATRRLLAPAMPEHELEALAAASAATSPSS